MAIAEILEKIEGICREYTPKHRPRDLIIGPRGDDIQKVRCVDGVTAKGLSAQLKELYQYSRFWQFNVVDLTIFDPDTMPSVLHEKGIAETIEQDFDEELIEVDGMAKDNSFLLWTDFPPSPFNRAYGVFTDAPEPFFVVAGSEVRIFDSLDHLLSFQLELIQITARQNLT